MTRAPILPVVLAMVAFVAIGCGPSTTSTHVEPPVADPAIAGCPADLRVTGATRIVVGGRTYDCADLNQAAVDLDLESACFVAIATSSDEGLDCIRRFDALGPTRPVTTRVELPTASDAPEPPPPDCTFSFEILEDGTALLEGVALRVEEFADAAARRACPDPAARRAVVAASALVPHDRVARWIDAMRNEGILRFAISARPYPRTPPNAQ